MKKYSSKKCSKGKTAYRTPSVFRSLAARKNKFNKAGRGNPGSSRGFKL